MTISKTTLDYTPTGDDLAAKLSNIIEHYDSFSNNKKGKPILNNLKVALANGAASQMDTAALLNIVKDYAYNIKDSYAFGKGLLVEAVKLMIDTIVQTMSTEDYGRYIQRLVGEDKQVKYMAELMQATKPPMFNAKEYEELADTGIAQFQKIEQDIKNNESGKPLEKGQCFLNPTVRENAIKLNAIKKDGQLDWLVVRGREAAHRTTILTMTKLTLAKVHKRIHIISMTENMLGQI